MKSKILVVQDVMIFEFLGICDQAKSKMFLRNMKYALNMNICNISLFSSAIYDWKTKQLLPVSLLYSTVQCMNPTIQNKAAIEVSLALAAAPLKTLPLPCSRL